MYAAAGGASIANRRKQKRLQLNKRDGGLVAAAAAAARARSMSGAGHHPSQQSGGKYVSRNQQSAPASEATLQIQLPTTPSVTQPTYGFHSSHKPRSNRGNRCPHRDRKLSSSAAAATNNYQSNSHNNHAINQNQNRKLLAPPPISPIVQFPISPPPLSLESSNSLFNGIPPNNTAASRPTSINSYANNNSCTSAAVAFPFPPPSFLDLRVSPSTSEPQCGGQGPGKAAWQGCPKPSPLPLSPASPQGSRGEGYKTKQCEAHRRWMKRNRIRDASYCYGSSGEDDDFIDYDAGIVVPGGNFGGRMLSHRRGGDVNAAVNTVLYAGLGTTALGLVISFVGTGEKGFLSPELRLVGPLLLCAGLLCCLLRVLLCLCLCRCCGECRWQPCRLVTVGKASKKRSDTATPGKSENVGEKSEMPVGSSLSGNAASKDGIAKTEKKAATTKLLPVRTPSTSQRQQPVVPLSSSSSSSNAKGHMGHELLLSPAQLPE